MRTPRNPLSVVGVTTGLGVMLILGSTARGNPPTWNLKPVPAWQAVPLPDHEVSFQRQGVEVARFLHSPRYHRPFVFPVVGPSGRFLTRMGHPHDPESHSHHNSVWISHHDVQGVSFWDDRGLGRIVHRRVERLDDGPDSASVVTHHDWVSQERGVLLQERRRTTVHNLPCDEWLLILDLELAAGDRPIVLGKTPFGIIGVRMAKSIGVHDGGGQIRNSEGGVDEAGCFWKAARWVDYAGATAQTTLEGIALFDHPTNPGHPAVFHVRDDGWMGASLTHRDALEIRPGTPLRLRYALYVHRGAPTVELIQSQWAAFTQLPIAEPAGRAAP